MKKFDRLPCPEFLELKWTEWGIDWESRRAANPKASFYWHVVDDSPVNTRLMPKLQSQTQGHCSFCDFFPVSPPSIDTIEHFRPKAEYPREAYKWSNLYYCCMHCQRKEGAFDDDVLSPDAADYSFERYFIWDFASGEVCVNPAAAPGDQRRAAKTISYFRLNCGHPILRRRELKRRASLPTESCDDFAYRLFVG